MVNRVIAYVDGFNLYYGLKSALSDARAGTELNPPSRAVYWLDLEPLIRRQLLKSDELRNVHYFSARRLVPKGVSPEDRKQHEASNSRQATYLDALSANPIVTVQLGRYLEKRSTRCNACKSRWTTFEEKETDVLIALQLVADAYEDAFDTAYIVSADGDLAPAITRVVALKKTAIVLLPPARHRADHLKKVASQTRRLSLADFAALRMPDRILRLDAPPIECPAEWMPPARPE